ncbi:hypothetical protein ABEB36_005030 [Hypothenemus hampei]|uniref:Uncharacterized protein n=1 Tax=Hypothenemus hampei TaxID=57062 RepID=A0ABD1EWQ2_HYPHA
MRVENVLILVSVVIAYPSNLLEKLTANEQPNVNLEDNSLERYDEEFSDLDIYFRTNNSTIKNDTNSNYTNAIIPFNTEFNEKNATTKNSTNPVSLTKKINPVLANTKNKLNETRNPRNELMDSFEVKESQQQASSEEEGGNMITGLLSAFLSGLSRPDGSIDLEAIVGLLGSLSTQNDDGSYDFSGLTDLLRSFFGGSPDGGGSDIGAFVGGLAGAVLKGVANPPGAKGAGILTGKVVTGVLPALSGPAMEMNGGDQQLDSGSFITGFLKTVLGSGDNGMGQGGKGSKYTIIKLLMSAITGLFGAASSLSSSKSD